MSAGERALHFFGRPLVRIFYRVRALGLENLPEGGFLLLPNHITWVDALVLQLASPRSIRYIIDEEFYHKPFLKPFLSTVGCIPIDSLFVRRRNKLLPARLFVCFLKDNSRGRERCCACGAVTS
jgi:acyl-[acyl-carrier-protein]-phospholipid O-acyltransferase/long-chain-fatty-acid--[acyl-carrier-protein] ligase